MFGNVMKISQVVVGSELALYLRYNHAQICTFDTFAHMPDANTISPA